MKRTQKYKNTYQESEDIVSNQNFYGKKATNGTKKYREGQQGIHGHMTSQHSEPILTHQGQTYNSPHYRPYWMTEYTYNEH